eukprot:scaffold137324_cov21-Tisochrysis_lutea.AAC.1
MHACSPGMPHPLPPLPLFIVAPVILATLLAFPLPVFRATAQCCLFHDVGVGFKSDKALLTPLIQCARQGKGIAEQPRLPAMVRRREITTDHSQCDRGGVESKRTCLARRPVVPLNLIPNAQDAGIEICKVPLLFRERCLNYRHVLTPAKLPFAVACASKLS